MKSLADKWFAADIAKKRLLLDIVGLNGTLTGEGKSLPVAIDEIEDRLEGQSALPADLIKHLTKRDVRDLGEFLNGRK